MGERGFSLEEAQVALANVPTREEVAQFEERVMAAIAGMAAHIPVPEDPQARTATKKAMQLAIKEINKLDKLDEERKLVGRICEEKADGTLYEIVGKTEGRGRSDFYILVKRLQHQAAVKAAAGNNGPPVRPEEKFVSEKEFLDDFVLSDSFIKGAVVKTTQNASVAADVVYSAGFFGVVAASRPSAVRVNFVHKVEGAKPDGTRRFTASVPREHLELCTDAGVDLKNEHPHQWVNTNVKLLGTGLSASAARFTPCFLAISSGE